MKLIFFVLDLMKKIFVAVSQFLFTKLCGMTMLQFFIARVFLGLTLYMWFFVGLVCSRSVHYHLRLKTAWCLHVSLRIEFLGFLLQITTYTQGYSDNTIPPRLRSVGRTILDIKQKCLRNILVVDHT